jgi:hypothetical protein
LLSQAGLAVGVCDSCQYAGPQFGETQSEWLKKLKSVREDTLQTIGYKGGVFDVPSLSWTQTNYIQPQMHPYDRFFYDPDQGIYTVDRFLDDLKERYGGVDSILMWPTYTNIGSDDRNQFDYFRSMPGGLEGVRNITTLLKEKGVRVLWPYNPWDTGTRREPLSDEDTFAKLLKQTGGDGFNGDTMGFVPQSFWNASTNVNYPLAFEPEGGGTDEALNWSTMGWGYWTYPVSPNVDRFKFITSGKFMLNICNRWAQSKTDDIQNTWFNGNGYESWENVWGTWNGIVPRDGEAIRRIASMLRFFGGRDASYCFKGSSVDYLHSPDWEPHVRGPIHHGIFASKFPIVGDNADDDSVLFTIVNRGGLNATGQQFWIPSPAKGTKVYDCYHGVELPLEDPGRIPPSNGSIPIPSGYHLYGGSNSYSGHGGDDIDNNGVEHMSVKQCTDRCDNDEVCNCVTYEPGNSKSDGTCWKRANCTPSSFQNDMRYDVFLQANEYIKWDGRNCYSGHGGIEIDTDQTAPTGLTPDQCIDRCKKDGRCGCVTFQQSNGKCWKRGECVPTQFAKSGNYDAYVDESKQPECPTCIQPPEPAPQGAKAVSFNITADGFGCLLQTTHTLDKDTENFLQSMNDMTKGKPLYSYNSTWTYLMQTMVPIAETRRVEKAPDGMLFVKKNTKWHFQTSGVMIEGDDNHGVDIQFSWEDHPQREHDQVISVGPFFIDEFPVTTTNYSQYLKDTGFKPADTYNWLKNWNGSTQTPPKQIADIPVTYISLKEARAFCKWRQARLPHMFEWQYAAQGNDDRIYPWGNDKDQRMYPTMQSGNVYNGPEAVNSYPHAYSPFGLKDLVGNVYQYTDEFQDDHTRAVILMGGSNYRPQGSMWYFPQALELNTHEKYFLMDDRYERAGTIGFRCVKDAWRIEDE